MNDLAAQTVLIVQAVSIVDPLISQKFQPLERLELLEPLERTSFTLFNAKRFDQIQQMGLVQTEKPCRRGAIAVSLRQRPKNDVSFGHF